MLETDAQSKAAVRTKLCYINHSLNIGLLENFALFCCQASRRVESLGRRCGRSVSVLIELLTRNGSMAVLEGNIGGTQARGRGCVFLSLLLGTSCSRLVNDTFINVGTGLVKRLGLGLVRR